MANYNSVICSNTFEVKEECIDNIKTAISFFEESYVDSVGMAFIGAYEETLSDSLVVLIDKRDNKVLCTFDEDYQTTEDILEDLFDEDKYPIEDLKTVYLFEYIQQALREDSYVFIKEIGHEKLRYAVGCGVLITPTLIRWIDLDAMAKKVLEEETLMNRLTK